MQHYLIHQLAKKTQLPVDTVRFYEKKHLIIPSYRAENNYKYYDEATLKRLQFIKQCRGLDMSLAEIQQLIDLIKQPQQGCQVVDQMIEQHILQVEKNSIAEVAKLQDSDVILEMAGVPVKTLEDVTTIVKRQAPGTWLPMKVKRDDQEMQVIAKFPAAKH